MIRWLNSQGQETLRAVNRPQTTIAGQTYIRRIGVVNRHTRALVNLTVRSNNGVSLYRRYSNQPWQYILKLGNLPRRRKVMFWIKFQPTRDLDNTSATVLTENTA